MNTKNTTLKLKYAFIPDPLPIRASSSGASPNHVDLMVMVSNPKLDPIDVSKITIKIPVGEQTARSLSADPNLPSPVYDQSGQWRISDSGSTITIEPKGSEKIEVTDTIGIKIPQIRVNGSEGVVPIKVVEIFPEEPKRVDGDTYELTKQPADFPVTSFYAAPAVLTKPEEGTTLYWKCSDQGKKYTYQLHSDSWRPSEKLSWEDGEKGVSTPILMESAVFALDIMETDPKGHLKIRDTLYTTVGQVVPRISPHSYQKTTLSGRIVDLHWLSFNAAKCSLENDAVLVEEKVPTNTYNKGYLASPKGEGAHEFTVRAFDKTGKVQTAHSFPLVRCDSKVLEVCEYPLFSDITPDGKLALVSNGNSTKGSVVVIDPEKKEKVKTLTIPEGSAQVAITPDGKLALVGSLVPCVSIIDLTSLEVEPQVIKTVIPSERLSIAPNGKYAFAISTNYKQHKVTCIDIAARKVHASIGVSGRPVSIAITPDSTTLLSANGGQNTVSIMDIATCKEIATIEVGQAPFSITITPDGKYGFVTNYKSNSVSVIDIPSRKLATSIAVGQAPWGLATTTDGSAVFVANVGDSNVSVINTSSLKAESKTISIGKGKYHHYWRMTPDGVAALVLNDIDNTVSLIDVAHRKVMDTIPVGNTPASITVLPDSSHAVVTNGSDNTITII